MKQVLTLLLVGCLIFSLSGCSSSDKPEYFDGHKDALNIVKDFAVEYYGDHENDSEDDRLTLSFFEEGTLYWSSEEYEFIETSDEMRQAVEKLEEIGFWYLWVSEDYVIFWRDETHRYGLLWSEHPRRIIKQMKADWYHPMDYNKVSLNWYEIGQLYNI